MARSDGSFTDTCGCCICVELYGMATLFKIPSPASFKGPTGPLRNSCAKCLATGPELLRCTGCYAVRYCSRDHQVAHRPKHKSACKGVKRARQTLEMEEGLIRNATADFMTPANAFETHVGRFGSVMSTQNYMDARALLVSEHLLRLGTRDGAQEALEHMQDMLRLCRYDHFGMRNIVPALMLRLDLDQECYDFVKWWVNCDLDDPRDWGDTTPPYKDIRGADVLEEPTFLVWDLNALIAVLLLKLKLLVDIRNLKIIRKIAVLRKIPFDIATLIELEVIRSPLSIKLQRQSPQSLSHTESKLVAHVRSIGADVIQLNVNFTACLFDPDEALTTCYPEGPWDEMSRAVRYSYRTWWETEGVLDLLEDARACATQATEIWAEHTKALAAL